MGDYCATPPFLSQAIYPNVLILLDNSGSMNEFAYKEDSDCRSWNGDVTTVYMGYNSTTTYYGYFDPEAHYTYNSSGEYFEESETGEWSGNFLNWLTMRRIDVAKKVLIGGKVEKGTSYVLIGQVPDRDLGKVYDDSSSPYQTPYHYPLYFYFYEDGGDVYFSIRPYNGRDYTNYIDESSDYGEYRVAVKVSEEPEGLVQRSWNRMRFGLEIFNNYGTKYENGNGYDGGEVVSDVSGPGENTSLVEAISDVDPQTWTPLAESLYEAIRYFKGENSAYKSGKTYTSPVQYKCQKNFVIIITDGESTKDENVPGPCFSASISQVSDTNFDVQDYMNDIATNEKYSSQRCTSANGMAGTYYQEGVAYYAHINDLLSSFDGIQNLTIYTVYCFDESPVGQELLKKTAKYGGFVDKNENNVPDMESEWDEDGDSIPDNYLEAQNGYELETSLQNVLTDILRRTASGTSASLLTKKTQVGKNLIQAVFYPKKQFSQEELEWVGYLYNYWFYYSLNSNASNIREDTIENKALDVCSNGDVGGDYILEFQVDNSTGDLNIKAYDSSCDGTNSSLHTTYTSLDYIHPVWEAGTILKDMNATYRTIYTYLGNTEPSESQELIELKDVNSTFSYLFGDEDRDGIIDNENNTNGTLIYSPISFTDLINYIYGNDISGYRNRKGDGTHTWKLGDIIYSTPKIVDYGDFSVVFVGANDGMLHAFKLGKLRYDSLEAYQDVRICNDKSASCDIDELGEELWAFIPKNSLPYLRALVDTNYCHMYFVDLMPYIIELDIDDDGSVDKRILIGGMRFGGGVGCSGSDCVNPPLDTCFSPSNYSASTDDCVGLSSYFALDITEVDSPKLLWEFTDPDLGFTYSGPAFIKRNGNYYVMFVSGPTNLQGDVDQDLKVFILEMNNDNSTSSEFFTIKSKAEIDSHIDSTLSSFNKSFGGRLFTEGVDYDEDGNTDMVFFGVSQQQGTTQWQGNVIGITIGDGDPADPNDWSNTGNPSERMWNLQNIFQSAIHPVTAKIEYAKCFNMNYIFFGTGRYFYVNDEEGINDQDRERLYGVRIDACFDEVGGSNCNINYAHGHKEVCEFIQDNPEPTPGEIRVGWYRELDPKDSNYFKERMISDPTITDLDVVFFSTTQPPEDVCSFGGRSRIWQLNCATGEDLFDQNCTGYEASLNNGKLFLQLSQGNIEQITPGTGPNSSFNEPSPGPTTTWRPGVTPESPTPFVSPNSSSSQGKILLWIEK